MRFSERIRGLKAWAYAQLCAGREMKAPGRGFALTDFNSQEPGCYIAWAPMRTAGSVIEIPQNPDSVVPGLIIMPRIGFAKNNEEQRFDRFSNIHRPQELGQHFAVDILFGVYEPGIRWPGFAESAGESGKGLDMSLLQEGTEGGVCTLYDWMDDCITKLLGQKIIPGTDLFLEEATTTYSLYTDQSYVVDRRPIYYGFVSASFGCHANEAPNPELDDLLD